MSILRGVTPTPPHPFGVHAIEAYHAQAISLTDVTIRPASGTAGNRIGLFLVNVGATTLTRVTIQDHANTASSTQASALSVVGANNVRITDSIFSNNQGGAAAIRAFHDNSKIRFFGTNIFSGNSLDIHDDHGVATGCPGCPPNPVVSSGGPGRSSTVDEQATAPSTCLSLPARIRVSGITVSTQCGEVSAVGIGFPDIAARFIDAVDVWSWVVPGTQVCFAQGSGSMLFLDAAYAPRLISKLAPYRVDGMICAEIDRAGTVVLMPGPAAPVKTVETVNIASSHLQGCMVTTRDLMRFRAAPGGAPLQYTDPWGRQENGWLPSTVTLTALERTARWFKVDYYGTRGWVSADYVTAHGTCG